MPTTANMSMILPTEGADEDVWDQLLNAALTLNDSHDHTTGKGVKIPSAALKINADVSWSFSGTNYAITDAKAVDFAAVAASTVSSYAGALFVNSDDSNNLYFRTVGGTNIKVTDGSTLNVSIVGGIGGDYSSVSALLDYDDATDTYRARQETSASVRQYAKFSIADLIIREYDPAGDASVPVETVTIKSPDALAASYALTLLTALPGATSAVQVSSTGALTASNTFTEAIEAPSFQTTSDTTLVLPTSASVDRVATHTKSTGASGAWSHYTLVASTNPIVWALPLNVGDIITSFSVYVDKGTSNTNTLTARIYSSDGTETAEGVGVTNSANAPGAVTMTESSLEITVAAGRQYYLVFTPGGGVSPSNDQLLHATVNHRRVA